MATRGETVINELLTKVGLVGVEQATAAAQAYDRTLDAVSVSSDGVSKAQLSLDRSLTGLVGKYSEVSRAAADLAKAQNLVERSRQQGVGTEEQRTIAIAGATERLTTALQRQAAIQGTVGPGLKTMAGHAETVTNRFGLASHQVQNLSFQLNDLVTQIGSGQGIFRPLIQQGGQVYQILQQGQGGVGGVVNGLVARLGRFGAGAGGVLGGGAIVAGVGLMAKGFSDLQKNIERSESSIRLLTDSSAQAERVLAGSRAAASGTNLYAEDLQKLRLQAEGLASTLGNFDATSFARGVAQIGAGANRSREEMLPMLATIGELTQKMTISAGEAQKLVYQFPELAGVLSRLFRTTPQGLLRLPATLDASTAALAQLFMEVGRAPAAASTMANLSDSFARLGAQIGQITGLAGGWSTFSNAVVQGLNAITAAMERTEAQGKATQAVIAGMSGMSVAPGDTAGGIVPLPRSATQAPQAASAGATPAPPGFAAPAASRWTGVDPAKSPDYFGARDDKGFLIRDSLGKLETSGQKTAGSTEDTASNTSQALTDGEKRFNEIRAGNVARDAAERAAQDNAEHRDEGIWGIYKNAAQTQANTAKLYDLAASESRRTPYARTSMESGFGSIAQANASSFGSLAQMNNPPNVGMGKPGQGATTAGSFTADVDTPGPFGDYARWVAAGGFSPKSSGGFPGKDRVLADLAAQNMAKAAEEMPDATAKAIEKLDLESLGSPIQSRIDALMAQQTAALQRDYKPDPYATKNPEFFYNGEKIFREGQDKVFSGLQTQIAKLEALQSSLLTLVSQGNSLPQTLVNALISAGFGQVAQQVVTAIQSAAPPPSATPAPTAVQGASMATPAKTWDSWQVGMKTL